MFYVAIALFFLTACKKNSFEGQPPILQGHRISGNGLANSLHALQYARALNYPSVEIDIALTKDHILVLHHDYWVDRSQCRYRDGRRITDRKLIKNILYRDLKKTFVCHYKTDAEPATPILSLEDFLTSRDLKSHVLLNLDIKYSLDHTLTEKDFAAAIVNVTRKYPYRKFSISASSPQIISQLQGKTDIPLFLDYPHFSSANHELLNIAIALHARFNRTLGMIDYVQIVEGTHADGISLPYQIIDFADMMRLKNSGVLIQVWTPNDPKVLAKLCQWPIDILISDYPEKAPCFRSDINILRLSRKRSK